MIQDIIQYCDHFNRQTQQYKESVRQVLFVGTEQNKTDIEFLLNDLGIIILRE